MQHEPAGARNSPACDGAEVLSLLITPRFNSPYRDRKANTISARSVKPKSRQFSTFFTKVPAGFCLTNVGGAYHNNQHSSGRAAGHARRRGPSLIGRFISTRSKVRRFSTRLGFAPAAF